MARTHGAGPSVQTTSRFQQDYSNDGVVTGKGGVPIPTTPVRGVPTLHPHGEPPSLVHMDDGESIVAVVADPPLPKQYEFYCDRTTWQRNMDGWQAMQILDVILGGLSVVLPEETARRIPADCRWHFKRREIAADNWLAEDAPITDKDRIAHLESEVADLRELLEDLTAPSTAVDRTPEELANSDPATLSRGDKIRLGKWKAAQERGTQG